LVNLIKAELVILEVKTSALLQVPKGTAAFILLIWKKLQTTNSLSSFVAMEHYRKINVSAALHQSGLYGTE